MGLSAGRPRDVYAWDGNLLAVDTADRTLVGGTVNGDPDYGGNAYWRHNTFTVCRFRTSETSIGLRLRSFNMHPLCVWVSGQCVATVSPVQTGSHVVNVSLPAGDKVVEVFEGTGMTLGRVGTFLQQVIGDVVPAPLASGSVTRRIVFVGDSITAGFNSSVQASCSMPMLVRHSYPGRVAVEAYTARRLQDDTMTFLSQRISDLLFDSTQQDVWISFGPNDYGQNDTVASFRACLGDLVSKVHVLRPAARVFLMSWIPYTGSGPNANGETPQQFRDATGQVAAASSSFCTFVSGSSAVPDTSYLTDGTHPGDAGHALYAACVLSTVG